MLDVLFLFLELARLLSGVGIVGAVINALLGGAGFASGRPEFFEGFRILQEWVSPFRCG
jgi:hypothetical protein